MIAGLVIAFVAASTGVVSSPSDADIQAAAERIGTEWISKRGGVGLEVCVARGEHLLVSRGFGMADAELKVPVDENSVFRIGSISKQFEAATILRLSERHKLALSDDVRTFVSGLPERPRVITVRNLLSQTSGLDDYTDAPGFGDVDGFGGLDHTRTLCHDEVLALVRDRPLRFDPGSRFDYSNTNSYLAGMIIERLCGRPYAEAFQQEVAAPFGLLRTAYDDGTGLRPGRARGYQVLHGLMKPEPGPLWGNAFAGGGCVSTARELVLWNIALVEGRVLSGESYTELTTRYRFGDGRESPYALNWWIDELNGHRRRWHSGHTSGFTAFLGYFPDDRLTIAVLSNSTAIEAPDVATELARASLGIHVQTPTEVPVDASALRALEGVYALGPGAGAPVCVLTLMDGHLIGDDGTRPPERLISIGGDAFVFTTDPTIHVTFTGDKDLEGCSFILDDNGHTTKWTRRARNP